MEGGSGKSGQSAASPWCLRSKRQLQFTAQTLFSSTVRFWTDVSGPGQCFQTLSRRQLRKTGSSLEPRGGSLARDATLWSSTARTARRRTAVQLTVGDDSIRRIDQKRCFHDDVTCSRQKVTRRVSCVEYHAVSVMKSLCIELRDFSDVSGFDVCSGCCAIGAVKIKRALSSFDTLCNAKCMI